MKHLYKPVSKSELWVANLKILVQNKFPLFLFLLFFVSSITKAQTTLSAGDIAVTAVNPSGTDAISFVLLKDIAANTVINFTDNGFASTTTGRTGEGFLIYTAPSAQTAGTVITWTNGQVITGTGWNSNNPSNFALNASGDQVIAFQGNTANWATLSSITLLFGVDCGNAGGFITTGTASASNSYQPSGLTLGTNLVTMSSSNDNVYFANGTTSQTSVSVSNTQASLLSLFANNTKWFKSSTTNTLPALNINVLATEPTSSVTNASISFTGTTATSLVTSWTNPPSNGGANRIAVLRLNSTTAVPPTDNTAYTTTSTFNSGSGGQLTGTGNYVIYNGSGTTVTISAGINASTIYAVDIYEFNGGGSGTGLKENYYATAGTSNTTTPSGATPTLSVNPASISFGSAAAGTATSATSVTVTAANLSGNITIDAPGGFEVSLSNSPFSSLALPSSSLSGSGGTVYLRFNPTGANGSNDYTGTNGVSFDAAGVTTQYIDVSGNAIDAEPTSQSSLSFTNVTTSSFDVNFSGGNGTKHLVLAKQGSAVSSNPVDAITYSASATFGSGTQIGTGNYVVYAGSANTVNVSGLTGGTAYYFAVYEYKDNSGTSGAENYLITSPGTANQQTNVPTYTWNVVSGNWSSSSSWTPARTSPGASDVLVFDGSVQASPIVTTDQTETIGQMNFINNVNATFTNSAAKTITIGSGLSGTDFLVNNGCSLNVTNAVTNVGITFSITAGNTGQVDGYAGFDGSVTNSSATHRLQSADANSLTITGTISTGSNFSGNLFGTTNLNSVQFQSGSTYISGGGANPFGASAPSTVAVFNNESNFKFTMTGTNVPSIANRTYANFEWASTSTGVITNNSTAGTFTGNVLVSSGTLSSTGTAGFIIGGNITASSGATFSYTPASTGVLSLNGTSQNINGVGTIILNTNSNLSVGGASTVNLLTSLSALCNISVSSGGTFNVSASGNLTINSTQITGAGAFSLSAGGTITTSNTNGIDGIITVSGTKTFGNNANYIFNGATTSPFSSGVSSVTSNNFTINANVTTNKTATVNGTLTLQNGTLDHTSNAVTIANGGSLIYGAGIITPSLTNAALPSSLGNFTPPSSGTFDLSEKTITGTLIIPGGASISIGSSTLTLNGTVSGTGTIIGGINSNLTIGGNAIFGTIQMDQTIPGTTNRLQDFTINKTISGAISLGSPLEVTGIVNLQNGTLTTGGNLTLVSNSSGTAQVTTINTTNADITGNVIVQRYIPAVVRRYRMLSPNVSSFTYSDLKDNIFVTGTGGATNGFDASPTNSATIFTYQESTGGSGRGWKGIANISQSLSAGNGALVFVRGDRNLASPAWYTPASFPAQNAVTVDFIGAVNKGTITPTITYSNTSISSDDGWNLVGNPYPSQIDWTALTKTNLDANYYILDPSTGSYVADNGSNYIASGQAFFVQAIATSPGISFTESAKVSSLPTNYFKTAFPKIQFKMVRDSVNSDVAWLEFNPASSKKFTRSEDALKFFNTVINIGFYIDSVTTTQRNSVPMTLVTDTFILSADAAPGVYTLLFANVKTALPSSKNIYLKDLFTSNIIDLKSTSVYTFTISSSAASHGNRFQLIIIDPSMLPVSWLSFSAEKENTNDVVLNWQTANEKNNSHFVVERSEDNLAFEDIGLVKGNGNSSSSSFYHFMDQHVFAPDMKTLYYRIKQVDKDGKFDYSQVISVNNHLKQGIAQITIFPNPVNDLLNIKLAAIIPGKVKIDIIDQQGKIISSTSMPETKDAITINTQPLKSGIYLLHISSTFSEDFTLKFVKE